MANELALLPAEGTHHSSFRLDSLRMGSVVVRDVSVVQRDLSMLDFDGLLGLTAYADLLATVD